MLSHRKSGGWPGVSLRSPGTSPTKPGPRCALPRPHPSPLLNNTLLDPFLRLAAFPWIVAPQPRRQGGRLPGRGLHARAAAFPSDHGRTGLDPGKPRQKDDLAAVAALAQPLDQDQQDQDDDALLTAV